MALTTRKRLHDCPSCLCELNPCKHENLRWFKTEDGETVGGCSGCGAVFASAKTTEKQFGEPR